MNTAPLIVPGDGASATLRIAVAAYLARHKLVHVKPRRPGTEGEFESLEVTYRQGNVEYTVLRLAPDRC
jgi:hypothetical protein